MFDINKQNILFNKYFKIVVLISTFFICNEIFALQNKKEMESFIIQNKESTQPETIKKNYKKKLKSHKAKDLTSLDVVSKVLQAQAISKNLDQLNNQSVVLYLEALCDANKLNDASLLIYVNTEIGFFYYSYNEYLKAMPYFAHAAQLLDITPEKKLIQHSATFKKHAYFYGSLGEHEKSIEFLKKALTHTPSYDQDYAALLNNIGSSYYKLEDYQKAEEYFLETKKVAFENDDKVRYAKALGDLALIFFHKKQYQSAIDLLKEDIEISETEKADRNLMYARILLSKIFVETQQYEKAKQNLQLAHAYVESKDYLQSHAYEIAQVNLAIAQQTNDFVLELHSRRALDSLRKEISDKDGQEAINLANWETQKSQFYTELEIEKAKVEKATLINWIIAFCMLMLIIAVFFVILSIKRKFKTELSQRENHILQYKIEQLQAQKKLIDSEQTLSSYERYLKHQNQQMTLLENELKNIQQDTSETNTTLQLLKDVMEQQRMSDQNWLGLKRTFIKEENAYYDYLLNKFPDLSETYLRIVILNKMGLQKAEISLILNVKIDVVEEALQRLRIKYNGRFDEHTLN